MIAGVIRERTRTGGARRAALLAALGVVFVLGAFGCRRIQTVPSRNLHDRPGPPVSGLQQAGELDRAPSPVDAAITDFSAELAGELAAQADFGSVACLPLVSLVERGEPRVTRLGEWLADEVAVRLAGAGYGGWIVDTSGMQALLADINLPRTSLHSIADVSRHGHRLGVDVVVFGTIRHYHSAGRDPTGLLEVDLVAHDLDGRRSIARRSIEIRAVRSNDRYWTYEDRPSAWQPGNEFNVRDVESTLDRELQVAARVLGRRVVSALAARPTDGVIYVAPVDTAGFVRSIARLRSAQSTFADEYARRAEIARGGGTPLDHDAPLILNGAEFPNLQTARAYLEELREGLQASDAMRLGMGVSSLIAEAMQRAGGDRQLRVNDIGFTRWSETQLVEGELATGGLARSMLARKMMVDEGIKVVVAPRLDSFASHIVLRVEAIDLARETVLLTTHFPIDGRFEDALGRQLGVSGYELEKIAVEDVPQQSARSWDVVYKKVASGVVKVMASDGRFGTGFVVSRDGHVMTNAHVVNSVASADPVVVLADGTRKPYRVVVADELLDIAVIKVDAVPAGTHVFQLADSSRARVGVEVAVLGNPKGTSGWVLTPGHLSSVDEIVPTPKGKRLSYMYTSPTRRGNSGSPVLLLDGSVIAVNSHSLVGETATGAPGAELTGFSFGAPSSAARRLAANYVGDHSIAR